VTKKRDNTLLVGNARKIIDGLKVWDTCVGVGQPSRFGAWSNR